MTKIYMEEVNHCWACRACTTYEQYERFSCSRMQYREFDRKEVNSDSPKFYFPTWCPLPDKKEEVKNGKED